MTDTELDQELENLLREALHAVAGATPTLDRRVARRSSLRVVPVAAAAIVLAGVTGVVTVVVRDQSSVPEAPATQPVNTNPISTEPVVLAPRPDLEGFQVTRASSGSSSPGFYEGAVRAPNGVVIGFTIQENPTPATNDLLEAGPNVRLIGGLQVVGGLAEGVEVGLETYVLSSGCIMAALTTSAGAERWAPELVQLVAAMTIEDGAATFTMPTDWTSLGAGRPSPLVWIEFSANIGSGEPREFQLSQRPDTSVGAYLANPRGSQPTQASAGNTPVWLLGESGGGWRTVVFDHDGTAVALDGHDVTDAQLLTMVTNLTEQPWAAIDDTTPAPSMPASAESEPANTATETSACNITVEIVEGR